MHLFPLLGQSGSRGVSIKVTLILQYGIYDKINQSMLLYINETNLERKNKKMQKTEKRTRIPPGGMGNGLERSHSKLFFISSS